MRADGPVIGDEPAPALGIDGFLDVDPALVATDVRDQRALVRHAGDHGVELERQGVPREIQHDRVVALRLLVLGSNAVRDSFRQPSFGYLQWDEAPLPLSL